MADFRTHVATSCLCGVGYAAAGHAALDASWTTCTLAGGICGLAGMLPDLDSDTGRPRREIVSVTAAAAPVLMMAQLKALNLTPEEIALTLACSYMGLRYLGGSLLKRFSVHRGMFHSLPAAAVFALLVFLLCRRQDLGSRVFKSVAMLLGYLSHLVLDEWYSIRMTWTGPRLKKSWGTALKVFGASPGANVFVFGLLLALGYMVSRDPQWTAEVDAETADPSSRVRFGPEEPLVATPTLTLPPALPLHRRPEGETTPSLRSPSLRMPSARPTR